MTAALWGALGGSVAFAAAPAAEDQVKAAFLFNFSQFVEWPPTAFAAADSPFVIAVVDRDSIAGNLEQIVRGETVLGHPMTVKRFRTVQEVDNSHILFIATDPERLREALAALRGRATLTVSDGERAAERGAMIQMALVQNRIRLRINVEAAKGAGLTLSSGLLRPAEIVVAGSN